MYCLYCHDYAYFIQYKLVDTVCNGTRVPLCVTFVTVRDDYITSLLRSMR